MKSFKTGLSAVMLMASIAFVSFSSYGATTENESPPDVETVMYDASVDADVLNVDYENVSNDIAVVEINTQTEKLYLKHSDKGGVYRYNYSYNYLNDINAPPLYGTNYFSWV